MKPARHQAAPRPDPALGPRREALARIGASLAGRMIGPAESAEAGRLSDLVLRRLGQIDDLLARFVDRMPPSPGGDVLRLLAAELVFAETPAHAAVDSAVRLAKGDRRTARLAGLVNAVGRRLAAQGAEIAAAQDAAALNVPGWLAEALAADWGADAARAIAAAHLDPAPHDLALKVPGDTEPLAAELSARLMPGGALRLTGRPQISALPGFAEGAWWVQDAAAQMPARMLGEVAGRRVIDLCAAPGGKTLQLVAAGAEVSAVDVSAARMERLGENLTRIGLTAECIVADALDWQPEAPFDAILLDAPCSATGTVRRHPDLPHRGPPDLTALTGLQARLLDRAFGWLAPGGTLVFATCSLLRAEGEEQAAAFLARTPAARRAALTDEVPAEFITADGDLRTRPDHWADRGGLDGFFAARFTRAA